MEDSDEGLNVKYLAYKIAHVSCGVIFLSLIAIYRDQYCLVILYSILVWSMLIVGAVSMAYYKYYAYETKRFKASLDIHISQDPVSQDTVY